GALKIDLRIHEPGSDVITLVHRHDMNGTVVNFVRSCSFHHNSNDVIHPGVVADNVEQDTRKQCFIFHTAVNGMPADSRAAAANFMGRHSGGHRLKGSDELVEFCG